MKKIITTIMMLSLILSFSVGYAAEMQFNDVLADVWYYDNLDTLYQKGIAGGYPDGTFRPDNTLKFEEFMKMLIVAVDGQKDPAEGQEWYQAYMDFAIEHKYMTDGQKELIGQNISRKTMAEIIYNVLSEKEEMKKYNEAELSYLANQFSDLTAKDANTLTVIGTGIISGYPDGTFRPDNTLRRSESVAVISRIINPALRSPITITADMLPDTRTLEELPPVDLSHLYDLIFLSGLSIEKENAYYDIRGGKELESQNAQEITNIMELLHNRDYATIKDNKDEYASQLLYYLNGSKEYKGVYYSRLRSDSIRSREESIKRYIAEGLDQSYIDREYEAIDWANEYPEWFECYVEQLINDTVNDKIKVQAKFYTEPDLAMSSKGVRGILRFKYDSHLNPESIKQELDLVSMEKREKTIRTYAGLSNNTYEIVQDRVKSLYLNFDDIPEIEVGKWYEMEVDVMASSQSVMHGVEDKAWLSYNCIFPISLKIIE